MTVGLVGGMGSYATLDFFERYLKKFKADKEWERPRIVIDNRCTMPSRVRAILYNENWNTVVEEIDDSIGNLIKAGCDNIILACNTSHVFLPDVYKLHPEYEKYVIHIIQLCAKDIKKRGIDEVSLIATEGTILSGIYQSFFSKEAIKVNAAGEELFDKMRYFIEIVKTCNFSNAILDEFTNFVTQQANMPLVLGCTEFPVIYNKIRERENVSALPIFDPLDSALNYLYQKYQSE